MDQTAGGPVLASTANTAAGGRGEEKIEKEGRERGKKDGRDEGVRREIGRRQRNE